MSPLDPTILASVSIDCSLRIWSLHPSHEKQPLGAICYGQGHKEQVLTLVSDWFQIQPTNLLTLAGISPQGPVHPYGRHGYEDLSGSVLQHSYILLTLTYISGLCQTTSNNIPEPTSQSRCTIHISQPQKYIPTLSTGDAFLAECSATVDADYSQRPMVQ